MSDGERADQIRTVSMVSAMFRLLSDGPKEEPTEASVEQRARFYRTLPGILFPEDWALLSVEDKAKRLDKLDELGLKVMAEEEEEEPSWDEIMYQDLYCFLKNSRDIERTKITPCIKNVKRRMKNGTYDHNLAPKLWLYVVKDAVKAYLKEGRSATDRHSAARAGFTPSLQLRLAEQLADEYRDEIQLREKIDE